MITLLLNNFLKLRTIWRELLSLPSFFSALSSKNQINQNNNSLIIIRIDAIGDYILFRNYLQHLPKYKDHEITLVGNSLWKPIFENYDISTVHQTFWIIPQKFRTNKEYRRKTLKLIQKHHYTTCFNSHYSRTSYLDDLIVASIKANNKIGVRGDFNNRSFLSSLLLDKGYSQLIKVNSEPTFEFYRNREVFSKFLNSNISVDLTIPFNKSIVREIVIAIGSGSPKRRWNCQHFSQLINHLSKKQPNLVFTLVGGPSDIVDAQYIEKHTYSKISNLVGQTTLPNLIDLIGNAQYLISNESSFVHIAAATNTPTMVISNGNHIGRFTPYPKDLFSKYDVIFPKKIKNIDKAIKKYKTGSFLNINSINAEEVAQRVLQNLLKYSFPSCIIQHKK